MRKCTLVIMSLFVALSAQPCGWDYDEDMLYYNLFDQTIIGDEALHPFLRDSDEYHDSYRGDIPASGNIKLWRTLLKGWEKEAVIKAVYSNQAEVWPKKLNKTELDAKDYITYAHACSDANNYRRAYSWDYTELTNKNRTDASELIDKGHQAMQGKISDALKLRYAYQMVRLFHYSGREEEGIVFWERQVKGQFERDEIYYYTLEQVSGCYYNKARYLEAALGYLHVFNASRDRKPVAFRSYQWAANHLGGDLYEQHLDQVETEGLLAAHTLMRYYGDFEDPSKGIRQLMEEDVQNPYVELLFMRSVNELERSAWPRSLIYQEEVQQSPALSDELGILAMELSTIAMDMQSRAKKERQGFWSLSSSYLSFMQGDLATARQSLKQVDSPDLALQKETLNNLYEVYSWKRMSPAREQLVAEFMQPTQRLRDLYDYYADDNKAHKPWTALALDRVGHLYLKEGHFAKSFLIHNDCRNLSAYSSVPLIDSLIAFSQRPSKTPLEELMMKRIASSGDLAAVQDYLYLSKGKVYLQDRAYPQALKAFGQVRDHDQDFDEDVKASVSARVFSNNVMECFECPEDLVMDDEVYAADVFDFIPEHMTYTQLTKAIMQLEEMTKNGDQWKQKLAHYLLGSYYYNMDNTGYYRGTLSDQSSCCHYHYFGYYWETSNVDLGQDWLDQQDGYNLSRIDLHMEKYYGFDEQSTHHLRAAMALSSDAELNARCLFLIAKAELNIIYNHGETEDSNDSPHRALQGMSPAYFAILDEFAEFEDTQFYERIIADCSYFDLYIND